MKLPELGEKWPNVKYLLKAQNIKLGFPGTTNRIIPLSIVSAASHWKRTVVQFYFSGFLSGIEKFALENEKTKWWENFTAYGWMINICILMLKIKAGGEVRLSTRETVFVCHQSIFRIGDCLIYNKVDAWFSDFSISWCLKIHNWWRHWVRVRVKTRKHLHLVPNDY